MPRIIVPFGLTTASSATSLRRVRRERRGQPRQAVQVARHAVEWSALVGALGGKFFDFLRGKDAASTYNAVDFALDTAGINGGGSSGGYAYVPGILARQTLSIVCTFRAGASGAGRYRNVFCGGGASSYGGLGLVVKTDNSLGIDYTYAANVVGSAAGVITNDRWHTAGLVVTPSTARLFLDGVLVASGANTYTFTTGATGTLLNDNWVGNQFLAGHVALYAETGQVIDDAEMIRLTRNSWKLFAPEVINFPVSSAAVGDTASLSSTGSASASFTGQAFAQSVLTSAGAGAASFAGQGVGQSTLTSSGSGNASFTGQSLAQSALQSASAGTAAFTGQALAQAALNAAGAGAATFVGSVPGTGVLTAAAGATALFTGQSTAEATLSAAGQGTVLWASPADVSMPIVGSQQAIGPGQEYHKRKWEAWRDKPESLFDEIEQEMREAVGQKPARTPAEPADGAEPAREVDYSPLIRTMEGKLLASASSRRGTLQQQAEDEDEELLLILMMDDD